MTAENSKIILGTRGSELARTQARLVEDAIRRAHPRIAVETKIITTRGDKARIIDSRAGRKGMFTAEIERALVTGEIDLAVHSAKDLPSEMSPAAEIAAVLPRAATEDVLISKHDGGGVAALPDGATVATGSVRRKHQLLWKRADLKVIDLRGNVPTRLRKFTENDWDAIVLARAGLERLELSPHSEIHFAGAKLFLQILPREIFLPAGGQGIIALQIRSDDESTKSIVAAVNQPETLLCLRAEREFLRGLQGDCNCPVAVLATIDHDKMKIRAQLFLPTSAAPREAEVEGVRDNWHDLATQVLRRITQGQQHEQE